MLVLTQIFNDTGTAARFACDAHITAMQDQPVMRILKKLGRDESQQTFFNLQRCFPRCDFGAIGDAKDMRIHRHGWLSKCRVEHHIGCLPANSRQRFQRLAIIRDFTVVSLDQQLACFYDVFGLAVVQADGFDVFAQLLFSQIQHGLWGRGNGKEAGTRLVDADICRLGGENDSNQQLK